jgi:hypothetical protein
MLGSITSRAEQAREKLQGVLQTQNIFSSTHYIESLDACIEH